MWTAGETETCIWSRRVVRCARRMSNAKFAVCGSLAPTYGSPREQQAPAFRADCASNVRRGADCDDNGTLFQASEHTRCRPAKCQACNLPWHYFGNPWVLSRSRPHRTAPALYVPESVSNKCRIGRTNICLGPSVTTVQSPWFAFRLPSCSKSCASGPRYAVLQLSLLLSAEYGS